MALLRWPRTYAHAQSIECLHDLQRQLSRRRNDDSIQRLRVIQQLVDDGQGKRAGLAASCLRERDDVPALQAKSGRGVTKNTRGRALRTGWIALE